MDLGDFTVKRCVSYCEFKPLNIGGVSWVLGSLSELIAVNRDGDEVALRIIVLLVEVKLGVFGDAGVDRELGFENLVVGVILVLDQGALGRHQVGSGQSLNFPVLQLPLLDSCIEFVKAFRTSASACGQVFEIFELPVSPACELIVSIVCDLVNFLGAGTFRKAGAEFSNEEWYSESVCVCLSLG